MQEGGKKEKAKQKVGKRQVHPIEVEVNAETCSKCSVVLCGEFVGANAAHLLMTYC